MTLERFVTILKASVLALLKRKEQVTALRRVDYAPRVESVMSQLFKSMLSQVRSADLQFN